MLTENINKFLLSLDNEDDWISEALTSRGELFIERLANRFTEEHAELDYESLAGLGTLPRLCIEKMIMRIKDMSIEENGIRGGDYLTFINELIDEISTYCTIETKANFNAVLTELKTLCDDTSINLETSKEKVIKIYIRFIRKSSFYGHAQYEGDILAKALGFTLIIQSHNDKNELLGPPIIFGTPQADNIPKVILYLLQSTNRSNHFNLHAIEVDDIKELIPHSILGTGNCLFDAIAQALIEIRLIQDLRNTLEVKVIRRQLQTEYGLKIGVITSSPKIFSTETETLLDLATKYPYNIMIDLTKRYNLSQQQQQQLYDVLLIEDVATSIELCQFDPRNLIIDLMPFENSSTTVFSAHYISILTEISVKQIIADPTLLDILKKTAQENFSAFKEWDILKSKIYIINDLTGDNKQEQVRALYPHFTKFLTKEGRLLWNCRILAEESAYFSDILNGDIQIKKHHQLSIAVASSGINPTMNNTGLDTKSDNLEAKKYSEADSTGSRSKPELLYSEINGGIFNKDIWLIHLCRRDNSNYSNHVFIIMEGVEEENRLLWYFDFVLEVGIPTTPIIRIKTSKIRATRNATLLQDVNSRLLGTNIIAKSWIVKREQAQKLLRDIQKEQQANQATFKYSLLSSRFFPGDNCCSWAMKHLKSLGEPFESDEALKRSTIDILFGTFANRHIPNLKAKVRSKGPIMDAIEHDIITKKEVDLYLAALEGNVIELEQLITTIDINTRIFLDRRLIDLEDLIYSVNGGETALHAAAAAGKVNCIEFLLGHGAAICTDIYNQSPLKKLTQECVNITPSYLESASLLLNAGDNPNEEADYTFAYDLPWAGRAGNAFVTAIDNCESIELALLLLTYGANFNILINNDKLLEKFASKLTSEYFEYYNKIGSFKLNFKGIEVTSKRCTLLGKISSFLPIKEIDFSNCNITDKCIEEKLAPLLIYSLQLEVLKLANNFLTYTGVRRLADLLSKHTCIKEIDLSNNRITCVSELFEDLEKSFRKISTLETVRIGRNFLDKSCKPFFTKPENRLSNVYFCKFFQTEVTKVDSLLDPSIKINRESWVVALVCKKGTEHAMIYMDKMRKNGQRAFERYHITAESFIGLADVSVEDVPFLKFFDPKKYFKTSLEINAVNGHILKKNIEADKSKRIDFSKFYPSSSKGKVNCLKWCLNKLAEVDIDIDPSLFGLPSHAAKGHGCLIL